jgi:hypothetical protein
MKNIFPRWGARDVLIAFAILALSVVHGAQAAGNPVRLTMTPETTIVESGKTVTFNVTGIDGAGESRDVTVYSSFNTDDPYGSMAKNVYTAGKEGSWTVTATMAGLSATSKVTVIPGPLATLVINPDSAPEILSPNGHRTFSALAYDSQNNRLLAPEVLWSVEGNIGTVDQDGRFTASRIGTGILRVQGANNVTDAITIKVRESAVPEDSGTTTSTNANTGNTNSPAANANGNTNSAAANTNANGETGEEPQITESATASSATTCESFSTTEWSLLLLAYAILVVGFYAAMRTNASSWWWLPTALLTAGGLWLFSDRRCDSTYAWWPYALLGIGVALSAVYLWLRPRRQQLGTNL